MLRLLNDRQQKGIPAIPSVHLSLIERGQIQILLELGTLRVNIAKRLGRSPSTIGREIDLNSTSQGYDAERAQKLYEERRKPCCPKTKLDYAPLLDYVKSKIRDKEWSPEIIAIRLPLDFPDAARMRVSHETLYREIYTRHDLRFLK